MTYTEKIIFMAQLLKHVASLDIYKKYPYAEKVNVSEFARVDWTKAIIVIDHNLQFGYSPYPLINLLDGIENSITGRPRPHFSVCFDFSPV